MSVRGSSYTRIYRSQSSLNEQSIVLRAVRVAGFGPNAGLISAAIVVAEKNRPCWWWARLLPPKMEGVCIPDTIFSASMPLSCPRDGLQTAAAAADKPEHLIPTGNSERLSNGRPNREGLVWAFSRAEVTADDKDYETRPAKAGLRAGGVMSEDGEGCGGTPAVVSSSARIRGRGGKYFFTEDKSLPTQRPLVQHRLYTKVVEADEDLSFIAKAICECGRRGGGTGSGSGGGAGSTLKLPLALMKVWGCQSHEERRRNSHPSDVDGKLGTPRGGRQLRVVSQWIPC